jgi:hypothetical protein
MVKHHILAVTLCTINRCKAVMGIGYSKFFGFIEFSYSSFLEFFLRSRELQGMSSILADQ